MPMSRDEVLAIQIIAGQCPIIKETEYPAVRKNLKLFGFIVEKENVLGKFLGSAFYPTGRLHGCQFIMTRPFQDTYLHTFSAHNQTTIVEKMS